MTGAFIFNANTCTGCGACRVACTIENGLAPDVSWRRIETFNPDRRPVAPVFHLSLACNHCATAACMHACPALAYRRDNATGAVLLVSDLCVGCGYCAWACPYDAPVFDETAGVMTKCTWCADRLRAGLKPACATHCPTGALDYGDVPAALRVHTTIGLPVTGLEPSLHVIARGADRPMMTPREDDAFAAATAEVLTAGAQPEISLRREWPLAIFTLGAATLVALVSAAAAGALTLAGWPFAVTAAAVMAIGGVHLGRKARAWRAILNVRHSWLSREIAALSAFVALASFWLLVAPGNPTLGWVSALAGFAGLFCADSVYGVLPGGPGYRHSAGATATGIALAAVLAGSLPLAAAAIAVKAWMYVRGEETRRLPEWLSAIRVVLDFVAPLALLATPGMRPVAVAAMLAGEAIGRAEYYMQLTRRTPRSELDRELAGWASEEVHAARV